MTRAYQMRARAAAVDETRRAIAAAAWRRFSREPFDSVTLAEVAEDAGVSARTVLNQFGSKEALFVAAFGQMAGDAEAARPELLPGDAPGGARQVCQAYEERGEALLLLEAQEPHIAAVRTMTEASRERHRATVKRLSQPVLSRLAPKAAERRLAQLVAATDVHFWHLLRHRHGLSARQTELAIAETLTALLQLKDG